MFINKATSYIKRLLIVASVNFFILFVLFFILELIFTSYDYYKNKKTSNSKTMEFDYREPYPYIMFHSTPNVDISINSEQQKGKLGNLTHIVTNRYGFRYNNNLDEKKHNEIRIFILGGSVVFNGLTNETTISGYLEKMLNERYNGKYQIRVVNAGIVSAVSSQELALLTNTVIDLKPDIMIFFDGFNDANTSFNFEKRLGFPFNFKLYEGATNRAIDDLTTMDKLLSASHFLTKISPSLDMKNRLNVIMQKMNEKSNQNSSYEFTDSILYFINNWEKMYKISKAYNLKTLFILQPVNPKYRNYNYNHQEVIGYIDSFNMNVNNIILELKRKYNSNDFVSFDGILDHHPEYFRDTVHTYDEGNLFYAQKIEELLVNGGYIK
ncbi:MAG: SGNH/GDSL hydrolase family protein [Nitrospirae bacterium]|nr:SGNH/GDSL hydrolase family protein [Nitrospirota bacterium]